MQLLFAKSKWEARDLPLEAFLNRVKEDGYDCTEISPAGLGGPSEAIRQLHASYDLRLVVQLHTTGRTLAGHLESMERQFAKAAECGAFRVNCHTGKDYFPAEENRQLFERARELSENHGIPASHETHRSRALFATIHAREYLEALPFLRLTADLSHWMVVHESLLEDQMEIVTALLDRTDHIHARVGFLEGPQVPDPFAPEHAELLQRYLGFWRTAVEFSAAANKPHLVITPEAGPPPYMPVVPWTGQPLADAWSVNRRMRIFLAAELRRSAE